MLPRKGKENKRYDIGYGNGYWFSGNGGNRDNDRYCRSKQLIRKSEHEDRRFSKVQR